MNADIYRAETEKSVDQFVADLATAAARRGFFIHNESKMDMAHIFGRHGVEVDDGFDLHMIQICKPSKAGQSLNKNPERAVLMPKFVVTFSRNGRTQIRFLRYSREFVASLIDDAEFPDSLVASFNDIVVMIEEARKESDRHVESSSQAKSESGFRHSGHDGRRLRLRLNR